MTDAGRPKTSGGPPRKSQVPGQRWASLRAGLPLVLGQGGFSPAAEKYRLLALNVDEIAGASSGPTTVVSVTAPNPGAGKTVTSLNLALTLARKGEMRVLLIECDLWKPQYEKMLTISESPIALVDLLRDDTRVPLSEAAVSLWGLGMDLLVGAQAETDGNLVTTRRMAALIREARRSYDFVILDSPPFSLASGRALAKLADLVLVVVGAKTTKAQGIKEVLTELGPEKTLGLVLNRAPGVQSEYSKYSGYSYGIGESKEK